MGRNCMAEVAKALGVELEEPFRIDGKEGYFRLTDIGLEKKRNLEDKYWLMTRLEMLKGLLIGSYEIIKHWRPNIGGYYYVPVLTPNASHRCGMHRWDGGNFDRFWLTHGLVCKTEEEAIAVANKMLAAVQEQAVE